MTNEMTAKEAVKQIKGNCYFASISEKTKQALDMAIKALETTCIEDYPTCTECEHYDSEKHYCPRFCQVIKDTLAEAQPSEDCISRQKALDCFEQTNTRQGAKYAIETLPSVTPQRKRGKWIFKAFDEETGISDSYWCSECNRPLASAYKDFCASCGSYNGGGEDEVSN